MTDRIDLTWADVSQRARELARVIHENVTGHVLIYPVPRGGIQAALATVAKMQTGAWIVDSPEDANVFVDDVIDSGNTRLRYERFVNRKSPFRFYALVDKQREKLPQWISFPWERNGNEDAGIEDNIVRILQYIGEDPNREGLKETPARVAKAYKELFGGYTQKVEDVLKVFEDGACDEMVVLRDVEFVSFCEHHMLPFTGCAHIAYLPKGKVVGVSKLARILDIYSRRLQIQERLTQQITQALDTHLQPYGSACVIEAVHSCMTCRGVMKQNSVMVTSSLTEEFRKPEVRSEFLRLIGK